MTKIKDLSIIILIVFIIASILYGIHMFRYEFIATDDQMIIRYDRITNEQCRMASDVGQDNIDWGDWITSRENSPDEWFTRLRNCNYDYSPN